MRSANSTSSSLKSSSSSISDTKSSSCVRRSASWLENAPRIWLMAMRCAARDEAAMTSAIASACDRSMRWLAKARWVNSPAEAAWHPHSMSRFTICCCIHTEPWHEISMTSSPVNVFGARNMVSTTWSSICPSAKSMLPRWAVCDAMSAIGAPFQHWLV